MEIFVGIAFGGYCLLLITLSYAWSKRDKTASADENDLLLSVVIPVRNEVDNITRLLKDLKGQQLKNSYEIIVIDDESEDGTDEKVEAFIRNNDCPVTLIHQQSNGKATITPKKRALNAGVEVANGNIIVTTDGDCRAPSTWLQQLL